MQKFPKFGFRRNTHTKNGKFKTDANVWQAHVWNRSNAQFVGARMSSKKALAFSEIVKLCNDYSKNHSDAECLDDEEIALAVMEMTECGLVEIEKVGDFETDIYDDGVKFWTTK